LSLLISMAGPDAVALMENAVITMFGKSFQHL
jgi:hypothetical protein